MLPRSLCEEPWGMFQRISPNFFPAPRSPAVKRHASCYGTSFLLRNPAESELWGRHDVAAFILHPQGIDRQPRLYTVY